MKSPRQRFRENQSLRDKHSQIVNDPDWERMIDAAKLQMLASYDGLSDTSVTTMNAYRMQGAQIFAAIFENLSAVEQPVKRSNPDELPHPNA